MKTTTLFAILGVATLTACASTDTGGSTGGDPQPDIGLNPSFSTSGASNVANNASLARGLQESDPYIIQPFGTSTYVGHLQTGNVSIDGQSGYGMVGDARIAVAFGGGSNSVTGTISNINLLEGSTPTELLTGQLNVNGSINTSQDFAADAAGTLGGVWGGDTRGDVNMNIDMDGSTRIVFGDTFLTNRNLGAIVAPNISGSGTGAHTVQITGGTVYGYEN